MKCLSCNMNGRVDSLEARINTPTTITVAMLGDHDACGPLHTAGGTSEVKE